MKMETISSANRCDGRTHQCRSSSGRTKHNRRNGRAPSVLHLHVLVLRNKSTQIKTLNATTHTSGDEKKKKTALHFRHVAAREGQGVVSRTNLVDHEAERVEESEGGLCAELRLERHLHRGGGLGRGGHGGSLEGAEKATTQ